MNDKIISLSIEKLKKYIERENYIGYDPYDGLNSPLFNLPLLKSNKLIRFGVQQIVKRSPINLRPFLMVKKGCNPVTLGLCIQAYAYLYKQSNDEQKKEYLNRINFLIKELEKVIPNNYSGACWGYDFDWEARYTKIPAYQPTIVATGIICNALYLVNQIINHKKARELIISATNFIIKDLNRTTSGNSICFSYSPFDKQQVFNASMKGVRLLSQAYDLSGESNYIKIAKSAVEFVVENQKKDGSWIYSLSKVGSWSDNYHTGYVLDCLDEYEKLSNDDSYSNNINLGYSFYKNNFITNEGIPKFYHNNIYPIDCTSASQCILTLTRFGDIDKAKIVAKWIILNMQQDTGSFKFRKFKYYTIGNSYMRWSNAWMFTALAKLRDIK